MSGFFKTMDAEQKRAVESYNRLIALINARVPFTVFNVDQEVKDVETILNEIEEMQNAFLAYQDTLGVLQNKLDEIQY